VSVPVAYRPEETSYVTAVQSMTELIPPPLPRPAPTPWEAAPAQIGFQFPGFPADYRNFVDLYGGGLLNGDLIVHVPMKDPPRPGLSHGFKGFAEHAAARAGQSREDLLAWGDCNRGESNAFWLMNGDDPNQWPVLTQVPGHEPHKWPVFDGHMADLVLALVETLADGWSSADVFQAWPAFTPVDDGYPGPDWISWNWNRGFGGAAV
jgi:hypothetical protein